MSSYCINYFIFLFFFAVSSLKTALLCEMALSRTRLCCGICNVTNDKGKMGVYMHSDCDQDFPVCY